MYGQIDHGDREDFGEALFDALEDDVGHRSGGGWRVAGDGWQVTGTGDAEGGTRRIPPALPPPPSVVRFSARVRPPSASPRPLPSRREAPCPSRPPRTSSG